jgi:hypothetical protein
MGSQTIAKAYHPQFRVIKMTARNIAAVRAIGDHLHFLPSPRIQALGFGPKDLGPDGPTARLQADELRRRCRLAERQDKANRALARAARLATGHDG